MKLANVLSEVHLMETATGLVKGAVSKISFDNPSCTGKVN
jgi:hypothetical protein